MSGDNGEHDLFSKVIIVGDSGVGKTNLITKFCDDIFEDSYVSTVGIDFKLKTVQIDSMKIKLQIWDTAGQERFRNITQTYFKGASAIIFAYQINSLNSFQSINRWIKQVQTTSEEDVCKVLVGTKIDLEGDREVESRQGRQLAVKHNMIFEEVSAKSGINVNQAFMLMAKQIKNRQMICRWQSEKSIHLLSNNCKDKKERCSCQFLQIFFLNDLISFRFVSELIRCTQQKSK